MLSSTRTSFCILPKAVRAAVFTFGMQHGPCPAASLKCGAVTVQHNLCCFACDVAADLTCNTCIAASAVECHGLVVWFDTEFSARFCAERPVVLSTSPHAPATHWAQTLFYFKVRSQRTTGMLTWFGRLFDAATFFSTLRPPSCCRLLRLLESRALGTAARAHGRRRRMPCTIVTDAFCRS